MNGSSGRSGRARGSLSDQLSAKERTGHSLTYGLGWAVFNIGDVVFDLKRLGCGFDADRIRLMDSQPRLAGTRSPFLRLLQSRRRCLQTLAFSVDRLGSQWCSLPRSKRSDEGLFICIVPLFPAVEDCVFIILEGLTSGVLVVAKVHSGSAIRARSLWSDAPHTLIERLCCRCGLVAVNEVLLVSCCKHVVLS